MMLRIFTLALVACLMTCAATGCFSQDCEAMGEVDLSRLAIAESGPWAAPLMPMFEAAAQKHDVPLPLLLTLGYFGSAFENRGGAPTIEGGYGVMALRENKYGGTSLADGASLVKMTIDQLKVDPAANIDAAAAALSDYAKGLGIDKSQGLEAWLPVIIKYAALDEENSRFFAMEAFEKLKAGMDVVNSCGERFGFAPQFIGSVNLEALAPPKVAVIPGPSGIEALDGVGSSDYGPAIWDPAPTCNYSTTWTNKDTVICHTIEGSAAGARSWMKNCTSNVTSHYVISEAGGVWQMVREGQVAWHASCYNSRSVGLEHEGYAGSPSHPQSLYDASALLVRDICNSWGIPKEKRTTGPGIIGHIDVTRCCCGTHTDPGGGWNWSYFIQQVNGGAPPPPVWSASYSAQSFPSTMTAGSTAIAWVEYTNTGTGVWAHGQTYLGTSSPQDRTSPFYNSGNWAGPNRPSEVDQSAVSQGQVGRFTFILKAPTTPGTYTEHYKLVREGVTWFGSELSWTITVTAATGSITGTVRNAANSQPIAGATVAISGGASTTTNSSGGYTSNNVNVGTYTLTASAASFNPSSGPVTVNSGETATKDFSLTPADTQAPTAPTGLAATAVSPSQINLSWSAATDNVGVVDYKVYRGGAEIGTTAGLTFQDNGLAPNTAYSYYVKARDAANNLSGASNTANATTFPGQVPIFQDGFIDLGYWESIVQSPMPGPYPPVLTSVSNHGTFPGVNSLRTQTSTDPNQGCLIGHRFDTAFGAAKFETYFFDGTGMSYGAAFDGGTEGWASYPSAYATLSNVGGGASGNCLQASDGGWTAGCYRELTGGFTAGESFTLSMASKWPSGAYGTAPVCFVRWFDGAGAQIGSDATAGIVTDNVWRQYTVTGAVPAGAAKAWIGHYGNRSASATFTYYADSVSFNTVGGTPYNNSRQGLQVRSLRPDGAVQAIYYLGTYSAAPGSYSTYSAGYYRIGVAGWNWPGAACRARSAGWHKFTLDFLPYTGTGDVKAYIDGTLVATMDRAPETETYGLNMVAYGYHYRVNVEGTFDDCAMYATQPHPAPTAGTPQALSPSSIRWNFTDNCNNEIGFRAIDAAYTTKATTGVLSGTGSAGYIDEGGLAANTPYTRILRAFNGSLDSVNSASTTRWTLSAPPSAANVTCSLGVTGWHGTPMFQFSAEGGFGQGTVAGFRYAWNKNPTHAFTGSEPIWSSGDLLQTASADGEWYLHVQGFNGEGVANGILDLGPYHFDGTPPTNPTAATETHGAQDGAWQSDVADPAFTWSGAADAESGISGYLVYFGDDEQGTSTTFVDTANYDPAAVGTGTYYLRVCAENGAGAEANEWATLFTFKYDESAPSTPGVTDDGPYSGAQLKLHASWQSNDAESGVAEFSYAVGTTAGGNDVVDWTSAGADTERVILLGEPGMVIGSTYFVSVKAKNNAGAWSAVGSSDGIQLAENAGTIAAAKGMEDGGPVGLQNKIVTASFAGSYYIEEQDRSSGILVLGVGPDAGALVTIGGVMGLNAGGERAILEPATIVESPADLARIPGALFTTLGSLGGGWFGTHTPGATGGVGLNNVGLLVTVFGKVAAIGEHELTVADGSKGGPVKVLAPYIDLKFLQQDDYVVVTGISSLETDGAVTRSIIRLREPGELRKLD